MRSISRASTLVILLGSLAARAQTPPLGTPSVTSSRLPIRIFYDSPAFATYAQQILADSETAWDLQVTGAGFAPPLRTDTAQIGSGKVEVGFDLYIVPMDPSAPATFAVEGDHPGTDEADCPTLGLVNTLFVAEPGWSADFAQHLLSHASLHAVDCLEPPLPVYDMVAQAVQYVQGTFDTTITLNFMDIPTFQKFPEWPLNANAWDSRITGNDGLYSFGSFIYMVYLEERFGSRDGKFLASMWLHTKENGHVISQGSPNSEFATGDVPNSPTYFDAIDSVLQPLGSSLNKSFAEFSVWRLLTGSRSDRAHFQDAAKFAEAAVNTTQSGFTLPLSDVHPTTKVGRYGSSYVELKLDNSTNQSPLQLSFAGAAPFKWSAQLVCLTTSGPATVLPVLESANAGQATISNPKACRSLFLAAENLSEGNYDVNFDAAWNESLWDLVGDYTFSLKALGPATITSATPHRLALGSSGAQVFVSGTGFSDGPSLAASFAGAGVSVDSIAFADPLHVQLAVSVASDTTLGSRDLTVVTGEGVTAQMPSALSIVGLADAGLVEADASAASDDAGRPDSSPAISLDASVTPDVGAVQPADAGLVETPADNSSSGCGCSALGGTSGVLLVGFLSLAMRRRPTGLALAGRRRGALDR